MDRQNKFTRIKTLTDKILVLEAKLNEAEAQRKSNLAAFDAEVAENRSGETVTRPAALLRIRHTPAELANMAVPGTSLAPILNDDEHDLISLHTERNVLLTDFEKKVEGAHTLTNKEVYWLATNLVDVTGWEEIYPSLRAFINSGDIKLPVFIAGKPMPKPIFATRGVTRSVANAMNLIQQDRAASAAKASR